MVSKPESYKICPECKEEYVTDEKDTQKDKIILRHNKKCPNCRLKRR